MDTTGLADYYKIWSVKSALQNVKTEVTRRVIDGKMSDKEAIRWLMEYGLAKESDATRALAFSKKYQSYVINYTYGMDLIRNYVEGNGGTEDNASKRWELFEWLLSNEVMPGDLEGRR